MYALTAVAVTIFAYSTYEQIQNSKKQLELQKKAQADAAAAAQKQYDLATQETNKQNAKTPEVGKILAQNQRAEKSGNGSTMLTGPAGVKQDDLSLSKNQLLGS